MPHQTAALPKKFLTADADSISRLQTPRERFFGEDIPQGGRYATLLAKAALLAPLTGGLSIILPAFAIGVAGFMATGRSAILSLANHAGAGETGICDLSEDQGRQKFISRTSNSHPHFVDDYLKLCQEAGFTSPPVVVLKTEKSAAAYASVIDGESDGAVFINTKTLEKLDRAELRAVIAHELTHIRLSHAQKMITQIPFKIASVLTSVVVVAAAVFSPALPFLPVIAGLAGLTVLDQICAGVKSQAMEKTCDRGTALLCGGTEELKSALKKLQQRTPEEMKLLKPTIFMRVVKAAFPKAAALKILQVRTRIKEYLFNSHPAAAEREALLTEFNRKYPQFCESRRGEFQNSFNTVAARSYPAAERQVAANTFKNLNNYKS